MAAHRKSDRRRVCLCADKRRKRWLGDVRVEHVQLGRTDLIVERRPNRLLHEGEFPVGCHVEFELEPINAGTFLD